MDMLLPPQGSINSSNVSAQRPLLQDRESPPESFSAQADALLPSADSHILLQPLTVNAADPKLSALSTAIAALYVDARFSNPAQWRSFSFDFLGTQLANLKTFASAFTAVSIVAGLVGAAAIYSASGYNSPLLYSAIGLGLILMYINTPYMRNALDNASVAFYGRPPINLRQLSKRDLQLRHTQTPCQAAGWHGGTSIASLSFALGQGATVYFGTRSTEFANYVLTRWLLSSGTATGYLASSPARAADAMHLFLKIFARNRSWRQRGFDALCLSLAVLICNSYLFALGAIPFEICTTLGIPLPLSIYNWNGKLAAFALGLPSSSPEVGVVSESVAHLLNTTPSFSVLCSNLLSSCRRENFRMGTAYALTLIGIVLSGALIYQMYVNFGFPLPVAISLAAVSLFSPAKLWALQSYTELSNGNPFDAMLVRSTSNFKFLLHRLEFLLSKFSADPGSDALRTQVIEAYCFFLVFCDVVVSGNDPYRHGAYHGVHAPISDVVAVADSMEAGARSSSSDTSTTENFPDPDSDTLTFARVLRPDISGHLAGIRLKLENVTSDDVSEFIRATVPGLATAMQAHHAPAQSLKSVPSRFALGEPVSR